MPTSHSPSSTPKLGRRGPTWTLALACLAGVFAVIGILLNDKSQYSFKTTSGEFYQAAQLLLFNYNPEKINASGWLQIAALLIVASALLGVYSLLISFWPPLRLFLWRNLWKKPYVVICGLGRIGEHIAHNYLDGNAQEKNYGVIAIEENGLHPAIGPLRRKGAIVIVGNSAERDILAASGAHKARRVFAVTGSDVINTEIAALLGETGQPVHVHVTDPVQIDVLRHSRKPIKSFNIHRMSARRLLDDVLSRRAPAPGQIAHYFIIGFGAMGQTLARELAMQAHFANGKRVRITIMDTGITAKAQAFLDCYPAFSPKPDELNVCKMDARQDQWNAGCKEKSTPARCAQTADTLAPCGGVQYVCNAEFMELPAQTSGVEFRNILTARLGHTDILPTFVICLEEERENFSAAIHLRKVLERFGENEIFAWLRESSVLADLLEECSEPPIQLTAFGSPSEVCQWKNVTDPNLMEIAQAMHAEYVAAVLKKKPHWEGRPNVQPWEQLRDEFRFSNQQRALHIDVKLRALRMKRHPKNAALAENETIVSEFTPQEREIIAQMEHNRWMAERLMEGWRYGARDDDAKLHNNLVPYECLPEETKAFDRSAGEEIVRFLKQVDEVVVRMT